jgi:integrase
MHTIDTDRKESTMVTVFKRSNGILYVQYTVNGKTIQKSTKLKDTKANRLLIKKEVIPALERKIIIGDINGLTAKDLNHYAKIYLKDKEHLKTYYQTQTIVKVLMDRFGQIKIDKITRGMIKDFVRDRLEINTPKRVSSYLSPLRGIFDIAIDEEVIKYNPCNNIKLPKHTKKSVEPFSREQVTKLLNTSTGWMQTFLAICFYTGMRTGEALGLMYSDIDLKHRVIRIKRSINKGKITTPKTDKSIREVPIFDDLLPYLPKGKKSLWVLPKDDGTPFDTFTGSKQLQWKKLLKECDIPYRKVYTTRHTFIVSMLKYSDLSILEIAQMVGHSSTQMIIHNYGKFIKGEHLKVDRGIKLFTDKSTDSNEQITI